MQSTLSRSFLVGAAIGALIALLVGAIWLLPFPFSRESHIKLVTIGAWLCPFYMLMFMSIVHTMSAVIAISVLGNAIVYGSIAAVARLGFLWTSSYGSARRTFR